MHDRKGFKMLATLNQHCQPDSVANAFTTLMLLFNNSMGESEEIMAFWSRINEMVNDMSRCKIILPLVLMVMFFLCSLHSHYDDLLEQFCSCYKSLKGAFLDSIVADVCYHNEFKLVGSNKKVLAGKGPKAAAAAAFSAVDKQGKEWRNPYKWLASFDIKGIKKRWTRPIGGYDFCPICHCDKDKHAPTACLLLAELNLKLIRVSPPAGPPAAAPALAASPSPGGHSAMANSIAFYYPLCKHAVVESLPPPLAPPPLCCANRLINLPAASSSKCIVISKHFMSIIARMPAASFLPTSGRRFTVADSDATNHMFPDKSAFISYRLVTNLQVQMGNNSFLPVLGRGLAIISLNGQRILVRNALHVPGLVVPLYSLHAHFAQLGCGFIGAFGVRILVYFPTFVFVRQHLKGLPSGIQVLGVLRFP
jgi:hypothetical protein